MVIASDRVHARARVACTIVIVGCSSGAQKQVEPERHAEPVAARDADATNVAPGTGDVQIRVEWHAVPIELRRSPARTPCGTAAAPAVAPTTTWGVPDAFVAIDAAGAPPSTVARVVLERCALAPHAVVTGERVAVTTTADAPVALTIEDAAGGHARAIQLPIAGHEVDVPVQRGATYRLSAPDGDTAWIAAAAGPFVAVTEANGQATLRDVPVGRHAVVARLFVRGDKTPRTARGEVDVVAGALAEVTLDISK
ncbi:MAG TPA: hypothetical protein VMJ10_29540 [Kofleriaceae bacterium]|nr:hypothetical protein [Kofleriaceae bacterium]